jgi:hypothetical protein
VALYPEPVLDRAMKTLDVNAIPAGSSPLAVVKVIFPGFRSWGFRGDRIRKHLIIDLGSLQIQSATRELHPGFHQRQRDQDDGPGR